LNQVRKSARIELHWDQAKRLLARFAGGHLEKLTAVPARQRRRAVEDQVA